eukprot:CAMPEP_0194273698 /NCGR_PEP_ID=MMETSP0169-20130528/6985_1 /TAXON_ID=218684 /ORGANISM="Corethron pennatum, Strain L29A3" /LENGTH=285 /DNA_ID=CAMNT_0039016727 /DNA_START=220 /DNA_END=1077 /DNA_ORIENTATION=-
MPPRERNTVPSHLDVSAPEPVDDDGVDDQIDFNEDREDPVDQDVSQFNINLTELIQRLPEDIRWQGDETSALEFLHLARLCDATGDQNFENREFNAALVSYLHSSRLREAVLSNCSSFPNGTGNFSFNEDDSLFHTEYMANINTLGKVAAVFRDMSDVQSADEILSHLLELLRGVFLSGSPYLDKSQILSDIGFVHRERREFREAASAYEQSLVLRISKYGNFCEQVAQTLESIAAVYYSMNDMIKCMTNLQEALACWRAVDLYSENFERVRNDIEAILSQSNSI